MVKQKKSDELQLTIDELTLDLQRTRADFENYRKRTEIDRTAALAAGEARAIGKLIPVIDTVSRALGHMPAELADNKWALGIKGIEKQIDKILDGLNLKRIDAAPGIEFNPDLHEAIQFDEDAVGDKEVISELMQDGYLHNGTTLRPAMVKVTKK